MEIHTFGKNSLGDNIMTKGSLFNKTNLAQEFLVFFFHISIFVIFHGYKPWFDLVLQCYWFCFVLFFNLLFWKDLWNSLSLCCLLQDLYHRLARKLSASLNHFHRLCIKRNGFFLPFFLSLTLSIWGQRIPLKKAYRSQHIMEEVRVCFTFFPQAP